MGLFEALDGLPFLLRLLLGRFGRAVGICWGVRLDAGMVRRGCEARVAVTVVGLDPEPWGL